MNKGRVHNLEMALSLVSGGIRGPGTEVREVTDEEVVIYLIEQIQIKNDSRLEF